MTRRAAIRQVGCGASAYLAPASAEVDPLLSLVCAYRTCRDVAKVMPTTTDVEAEAYDAFMDAFVDPLFWRLAHDTPSATTAAGALAALRLLHEGMLRDDGALAFDRALAFAAMRFLERTEAGGANLPPRLTVHSAPVAGKTRLADDPDEAARRHVEGDAPTLEDAA